ncbi:MAG: PPOX class F420-dependent oxidoreductase [Thermomicrobiales bacterium]
MAAASDSLTARQIEYLKTQRLGRLATVDADGAPQNNPVGFRLNADGTIDIPGFANESTRKWRNVARNPRVAFVVDDFEANPWRVRFVEVRGTAEQIPDPDPDRRPRQPSKAIIRITPTHVYEYGLDGELPPRAKASEG